MDRTLVMLKKNEEKLKQKDESIGIDVLQESFELTTDLENELESSVGHEDLDAPTVKTKRVYTRRKYESSSVRRSVHLNFKSK